MLLGIIHGYVVTGDNDFIAFICLNVTKNR